MNLAHVRAMVDQFVGTGADPRLAAQREAVVQYVAAHGVPVLHAVWALYGRTKGKPCCCAPCTDPPLTGEVVLRILVAAPEERT